VSFLQEVKIIIKRTYFEKIAAIQSSVSKAPVINIRKGLNNIENVPKPIRQLKTIQFRHS
jgi:hypothetical protein